MRLKNITRYVNEDDSVITPVDSTSVGDKETNISILVLNGDMNEVESCTDLVSNTVNVVNTLSEMNSIMKGIDITNPSDCLTPHEADTIDILVEHLKRSIKYKGDKRFPSMETFGGSMSRSKAHRLAIEDLDSLCNEIKAYNRNDTVIMHERTIKTAKSIMTSKSKLVEYINKTIIESNEFYTGGKYQPSLNGSDLIPKPYIRYIFNLKESLDGKMPSVAILNGLKSIKSNIATNTLLPFVNKFKSVMGSFNKSSLTEESNSSYITKMKELIEELTSTYLPFSRPYRLYERSKVTGNESTHMDYPLSDTRIDKDTDINDGTMWIRTHKGNLPDGIKVGALSDQESNVILTDSLDIISSFEIDNLIVECIELCILNKERLTKEDVSLYLFTSSCTQVIDLIHKLSYTEITIINGLVDYCKDSIDSLNKKVIDTGIK